jgi:hypothetical protein
MGARKTSPVEVPGQLLMFAVPTPAVCICSRGRTTSVCGYDRHCGACSRCLDCKACAGPGCTCDCEGDR